MSLHVHSYFSFGGGTLSPEEICRRARENGEAAVGLADTGNLYGLVRFLVAARREGLKPVAGAVLVDAQERELATAYVLDRGGFARLAGLLSRWPGQPAVDLRAALLEGGWEGLALLCSDEGLLAELAAAARRAGGRAARPSLYARLVYGRPFRSLVRAAAGLGVPLCAVNDAWYAEEGGAQLGDLLAAMRRLCRLEDLPPGARLAPWQRWVGRREMERFFSAVPEALDGARELAERADSRGILAEGFVFPAFAGLSEEEAFRRLRAACQRGVARRYGGMRPDGLRRAPGLRAGASSGTRASPPTSWWSGHRAAVPPHLRPGERRVQHRLLPAGHHPRGPPAPQPVLRALPEQGPQGPPGHRRGLPLGRAGEGPALRVRAATPAVRPWWPTT